MQLFLLLLVFFFSLFSFAIHWTPHTTRLCRMHHFFCFFFHSAPLIWSITFHAACVQYMYFHLYVTAFTLATSSRLNDKNCVHAVTIFFLLPFSMRLRCVLCAVCCGSAHLFVSCFDFSRLIRQMSEILSPGSARYATNDQIGAVLSAHEYIARTLHRKKNKKRDKSQAILITHRCESKSKFFFLE